MSVASRARVLAVCVAFAAATTRADDPNAASPSAPADSVPRPTPRPAAARAARRPPPALVVVPLGLGLLLPITLPNAVPRERRPTDGSARPREAAPVPAGAKDAAP